LCLSLLIYLLLAQNCGPNESASGAADGCAALIPLITQGRCTGDRNGEPRSLSCNYSLTLRLSRDRRKRVHGQNILCTHDCPRGVCYRDREDQTVVDACCWWCGVGSPGRADDVDSASIPLVGEGSSTGGSYRKGGGLIRHDTLGLRLGRGLRNYWLAISPSGTNNQIRLIARLQRLKKRRQYEHTGTQTLSPQLRPESFCVMK
jgi:hypothetical protein